MDGVLFFDGNCGMCTRARNGLLRLNRTGRLHTEPLQVPGVSQRVGVAAEHLMESVWWLDASGAVFGGAEAVNAALSAALGTRLPIQVYRLPGVRSLEERIYRWVAAHRYKFRGVTPLCEAQPGQCAAPEAS